jgi:elongation factor P--beta-lysine ligase
MRYVDLVVNPNVKEVFIKEQECLLRTFFNDAGYMEVETPVYNQCRQSVQLETIYYAYNGFWIYLIYANYQTNYILKIRWRI